MNFQIRKDADVWFKSIRKPYLSLDWDCYYYCLMTGLAAGIRRSVIKDGMRELTDKFPGDYKAKAKLLLGLLLVNEVERNGLNYGDKKEMTAVINRIVDPNGDPWLTSDGLKLMNDYASVGFDVLYDEFTERPKSMEVFIRKYHITLKRLTEDRQKVKL